MPGRYTDELRKITRAQAGTPDTGPASADDEPARTARRGYRRLLSLCVVLALVGAGWFVLRQLTADAKLQDCVMSGRKNCAPVDVDPVGR